MNRSLLVLFGLVGLFFCATKSPVEAQERVRINWQGPINNDHVVYIDLFRDRGARRSHWIDENTRSQHERRLFTFQLPEMSKSYREVKAQDGKREYRIRLHNMPKEFVLRTANGKLIYVQFAQRPPDAALLILKESQHGNWMVRQVEERGQNLNVRWVIDPNGSDISPSPNSPFSHCFELLRSVRTR